MRSRLAGAFKAAHNGSGLCTVHALISRAIPDGCIQAIYVGANQLYIIGPNGTILVQPNLVAMIRGLRHATKRFNELSLVAAIERILRGTLRFVGIIAAGVDAVMGLLAFPFVLQDR